MDQDIIPIRDYIILEIPEYKKSRILTREEAVGCIVRENKEK